MDEILEDKGMIGGSGLVIPRKLKARISNQFKKLDDIPYKISVLFDAEF